MAQAKVTYNDQILPLVETHCAKCHNADKRKGDLDLTSYPALMKGGGSGAVVVSGNPDSSKLWKALSHAEEPTMPPNKPPLPEKELNVFRQWITGGLLENTGSKAVIASKPTVDLALKTAPNSKPEGPPPMPGALPIDPVIHTARRSPITGLATSPWAPLLAITGQKQILLYNTADLRLLGILPFPPGQPWEVRFSRSGKVLLASGGHAAKSGQVTLWNVESGQALTTLGNEYDVVLTADLSPDQSKVALGGPDRLVKIYAVSNGELLHKLKKHTDWVTSVSFSPNGEILASADRNGGLVFWDPDNGQELVTTAGHKSSVTALSWRGDSKLLASASEDGTVKLWDSSETKAAKTWNAHASGVLGLAYSHDGKLVSSGRDGLVITWSADGSKLKSCEFFGEPALRCAFTDDGTRVVASDLAGRVGAWEAQSGRRLGEFDSNPSPLSNRIAEAQQHLVEIQTRGNQPTPAVAAAGTELQRATNELAKAQDHADKAKSDFTAKAQKVAQLKELAAKQEAPAEINSQLAAARAVREESRAINTAAQTALETKTREVAEIKERQKKLGQTNDPAAELARAKDELKRLTLAQQWGEVYRARETVAARKGALESLASAATAAKLQEQLATAKDSAERSRLKASLKTAEAEKQTAEAALEKARIELNRLNGLNGLNGSK